MPTATSSASTMRRKNLKEHRCPRDNFSSQLKHNPFSRWTAISSSDNRLRGRGGSFAGGGSRVEGDVVGNKDDGFAANRPQKAWQWSASFSSYIRARVTTCIKVRGWRTWTSRWMSGANPEIKQLRRNGVGNPTIFLARDSNYDK